MDRTGGRSIARGRAALVACSTAVLVAAVLVGGPARAVAAGTSCVPPVVAHRGDAEVAPENTLPAFTAAMDAGARTIELDVRFAGDDVPVVLHDRTLDRTTDGSGEVAATPYADVRRLDAGSWFGPAFAGTKVPTLYEVLKLGKGYGARYFVELKVRPTTTQLELVLKRFRWLGVSTRVTVSSFDAPALGDVRGTAPRLRTALVERSTYRTPTSVKRHGRSYLPHWTTVTAWRVRTWVRAGILVFPWTPDTRSAWRSMRADGASGTITNRATAYLSWARSVCS